MRRQRQMCIRDSLKNVPDIGPRTYDNVKPYLRLLQGDLVDPWDGGHQYPAPSPGHAAAASIDPPMPMTETQQIMASYNLTPSGTQALSGSYQNPHQTFVIEHFFSSWTMQGVFNTASSTMKVGDLWSDSGCVRGVGGRQGHFNNRKHLLNYGLKPIRADCSEEFKFGNGDVEHSSVKYYYPVFIKGIFRGTLDQAEVNTACPQLLSKKMMKQWDMDLCFGKQITKMNKFGVQVPFSKEKDLPLVNIFDFTAEDVAKQWSKIPDHFKIKNTKPPLKTADMKRQHVINRKGKTVTLETVSGKPPQVVHQTDVLEMSQ